MIRTTTLIAAFAIASLAPVTSYAQPRGTTPPEIVHGVTMRGSVVRATGRQVVLCIGSADGAQAGQELKVYRIAFHPHGPKPGIGNFQRTRIGSVRIDGVIDEHFANASVISGSARLNDIVELERH